MQRPIKNVPMVAIRRMGSFEMAHRLTSADTVECNSTVHGHSYKWELCLTGMISSSTGMLFDFKHLKNIMGTMERVVDHALWLPAQYSDQYLTDKKVLVTNLDPTAEVMSVIFCLTVCHELFQIHKSDTLRLQAVQVTLWETEGNCASTVMTRDSYQPYTTSFPMLWVINRNFRNEIGLKV